MTRPGWTVEEVIAALAIVRSSVPCDRVRVALERQVRRRCSEAVQGLEPGVITVQGVDTLNQAYGVDVRANGTVRAWVEVAPVLYDGSDAHVWEIEGTDLDRVVAELAVIIGLA